MEIVSCAWTTPALIAGYKTATRRDWNDDYVRRFKPGELVEAHNCSSRHRGKHVATILILSVTKEPDALSPDSDYEDVGFTWLADRPHLLPKDNRNGYLATTERESFNAWREQDWTS